MKKIIALLYGGGIVFVIAALILPRFSEIAIMIATVGAVGFVVGYILLCESQKGGEKK